MKTVTQFAEYSITGGLLWFNAFLFFTILTLNVGDTGLPQQVQPVLNLWADWARQFGVLLESVAGASVLGTIFNAILSVLSVILLYLSGIALDLLASLLFRPFEMIYFRRELRRDCGWLTELTRAHAGYLGEDFHQFTNGQLIKLGAPGHWFEQRRRYIKIRAFLISYMIIHGSEARLDDVLNQVRVWRMTRAFAASLAIFAVMLSFSFIFGPSEGGGDAGLFSGLLTYIVLPLTLLAMALGLALGTYTKTNATIAAITYATSRRQAPA